MVGLSYNKPRKLLDGCRLAPAVPRAAFAHFFLEPVAESRWAEPLAYFAHERDDGGGKRCAIPLPGSKHIHELFQARTGVTFPERNSPVKKSTKGTGGVIVVGQYQKRGLRLFKCIYLSPVLTGELVFQVSLRLVFGKDDANTGRQPVAQIDNSAGFQCAARHQGPLPQIRTAARPSVRKIQLLKCLGLACELVPVTGRTSGYACSFLEYLLHGIAKYAEPCALAMQRHDDGMLHTTRILMLVTDDDAMA